MTHPASCTTLVGGGSSTGQREYRAQVSATARVTFATLGPAFRPGSGIKMKMPATRANTSRNPHSSEAWTTRLSCIAGQVAKDGDRVGGNLLEHPGHQQQKPKQKR